MASMYLVMVQSNHAWGYCTPKPKEIWPTRKQASESAQKANKRASRCDYFVKAVKVGEAKCK